MELPIVSLQDMLMSGTKEDLVTMARRLHIKIKSSLRKEPFAATLSSVILHEPLVLLNQLSWSELMRLRDFVHDPTPRLIHNHPVKNDSLESMGIVVFTVDEDKFPYAFISYELVERLKTRIDPYIASQNPNSTKFRRRQLLTGLLNLYGVLGIYEIRKLAREFDPEFYDYDIMKCFSDSYELQSLEYMDSTMKYQSGFLLDHDDILAEMQARPGLKPRKFTLEELLASGDTYHPMPPTNAATREFRKILVKNMASEEAADRTISEIWMLVNNDVHASDILSTLTKSFTLDKKKLQELVQAYMEFTNHIPRWILKGNTSREVFEQYEKPNLLPLPKTPFVFPKPGSQPDKEGRVVPFPFNPTITGNPNQPVTPPKKIGRNDPCFCGSGRKYKNCCGN